jgi:DNA-binding IclR family transcriptional regulator
VLTRDWTGSRFPYHTVAGGYALMSTWSDQRIGEYAADGLEAFTEATETTLAGVRRRVAEARRLGWVWTIGDFSIDINGVGSAVVDANGVAVAAISVYGPAYRFPDDRDRVGALVLAAALAVSRRLRGD